MQPVENPKIAKLRWIITDEYNIGKVNNLYANVSKTFYCKKNCGFNYLDKKFLEKLKLKSSHISKNIIGVENPNNRNKSVCKSSVKYKLEIDEENGMLIPVGMSIKERNRMIVSFDINNFKNLEHTDDLCEFVLKMDPMQIKNIKNPSFKLIKLAVEYNFNVYPFIMKYIDENKLKELVLANPKIIKFINDKKKFEYIAIKLDYKSLQYIKNPSNKLCTDAYLRHRAVSLEYMNKIPDNVIRMALDENANNIRWIPVDKQTKVVLEFFDKFIDNYWDKPIGLYQRGELNKNLFTEENLIELIENSANKWYVKKFINECKIKVSSKIKKMLN